MKKEFFELLARQKQAQKNYNLTELNAINKQLFKMREQARKEKKQARETARDEKLSRAIYNRLAQDNENGREMGL